MALEGYKSNLNVMYSSKYHVVWTPKYRRSVLVGDVANRQIGSLNLSGRTIDLHASRKIVKNTCRKCLQNGKMCCSIDFVRLSLVGSSWEGWNLTTLKVLKTP